MDWFHGEEGVVEAKTLLCAGGPLEAPRGCKSSKRAGANYGRALVHISRDHLTGNREVSHHVPEIVVGHRNSNFLWQLFDAFYCGVAKADTSWERVSSLSATSSAARSLRPAPPIPLCPQYIWMEMLGYFRSPNRSIQTDVVVKPPKRSVHFVFSLHHPCRNH